MPHLSPISFIFMKLSANILPNNRSVPLYMGFKPPLGNPGSATGSVAKEGTRVKLLSCILYFCMFCMF